MFWTEKVNAIKEGFSKDDFSVPMTDRKTILRKIETEFIIRPKDYYFSNDFNGIFNDWWPNLKSNSSTSITLDKNIWDNLDELISEQEDCWFATEFDGSVKIYKARKPAILALMQIGRTWSNTYHVIGLKYESMTSFRFETDQVIIRSQEK